MGQKKRRFPDPGSDPQHCWKSRFFRAILAHDGRIRTQIRIPVRVQIKMEPDPGGPKTYRSGSTTAFNF
jgi:hypothetical protein